MKECPLVNPSEVYHNPARLDDAFYFRRVAGSVIFASLSELHDQIVIRISLPLNRSPEIISAVNYAIHLGGVISAEISPRNPAEHC